ncbi:CoA transferase, partial [Streptomyces sp. NPDC056785]
LDPVVEAGEGERAVPTTRHPIRFSETPAAYRLPPPVLDEHGEDVRAWLEGGPDPRERPTNGTGPRARTENADA